MILKIRSVILMFIVVLIAACTTRDYDKLVQQELNTGIVNDSLFLNVHLGMGRKDFYTSCWEMNKEGLIRQGPNNLSVQYNIDSTELKFNGQMHFYPEFDEDNKISRMPMEFVYTYWSPWDPRVQVEVLLNDVKNLLEKWYGGNKFIYLENNDGSKKLWVKVDGTRRIRLYKKDIRTVRGDISDLRNIKESTGDEE